MFESEILQRYFSALSFKYYPTFCKIETIISCGLCVCLYISTSDIVSLQLPFISQQNNAKWLFLANKTANQTPVLISEVISRPLSLEKLAVKEGPRNQIRARDGDVGHRSIPTIRCSHTHSSSVKSSSANRKQKRNEAPSNLICGSLG